ncbi:hypothetical protein BEL04_21415 [Mucilaginibacter sp. PPCGB 2223]|uniref:hypothetical protein n=1 Tax=Mucilaginibacter sp. PPCGB 2223 TaxID=1886027 RepID=UPI0008252AF1|nr:hypothetical protein [Mucilaginibacter sp. PPCGB 2223]OCX50349.1 hypothetical protein BEL04_21415 [Mucilaginibacter sp. PPCGB 2223]
MKKLFLLILAGFIIIDIGTACFEKAEQPTIVHITVINGNPAATGSATICLYRNMTDVNNSFPLYTQTTIDNNSVDITVDYLSQYYVVVTKGPAKNYYSGYIPVGLFQSQTDINNSATQNPAGTVGGVKFRDINGDGVINNSDKTDAPTIAVTKGTENDQSVTVY